MDLRLSLLETFVAQGSDGAPHKVCAFDRLARDPSLPGDDNWASTGAIEYRLEDGRLLHVQRDGTAAVERSSLVLTMPERAAA
jgi:hypothetical protein